MSRKKINISKLNTKNIGDRVAFIRAQRDESQEEFGNNIGLSKGNVSNLENCKYDPSYSTLYGIVEKYKVNPVWLLTGIGNPFETVFLEDKTLFFDHRGDPIKEHTDNFKMDLEVITREEAERRKKATAVSASNIDTSNPSTPSTAPGADPCHEFLVKTRLILESKTGYANSLAANINSFYDAVVTTKKYDDLENRLARLEKLSTDGREKEDIPDTALAAGS